MQASVATTDLRRVRAAAIRRVNRSFHARAQACFDREHRRRHRAERGFWEQVAGRLLEDRRAGAGSCAGGLVVVDLACGTGFAGRLLGRRLGPGDRLLSLDLTEEAIRTVQHKWRHEPAPGGPRLIGSAADAADLPLADASVDLVAMNAALHHMAEPADVLAEIDRVLRPGGLFALGFEPNAAHFRNAALRRLSVGLDRLAWYLDFGQNRRRLRQLGRRLGLAGPGDQACRYDGTAGDDDPIGDRDVVEEDLPADLLELLDPHARGAGGRAGFDPCALLAGLPGGYETVFIRWSDYLGDAARRLPPLRGLADAAMGVVWPGQGVLFSWLVRKPGAIGKECPAGPDAGGQARV